MNNALPFKRLKSIAQQAPESCLNCSSDRLKCCTVLYWPGWRQTGKTKSWVRLFLQTYFGEIKTPLPLGKPTLSNALMSWSGNKGDHLGSHVPAWCAGAPHPAANVSHRAPPHQRPEPSPPAGATPQVHSQENSPPSSSSHTWKSKEAYPHKFNFALRLVERRIRETLE